MNQKNIADFELAQLAKKRELQNALQQPFSLENPQHLEFVKKYLNEFDLICNQMYLYQALSESLKIWGSVTALGFMVYVPNLISYCSSIFLYTGISGLMLENFRKTDFYDELTIMKQVYNWALKNNNDSYDSNSDNTAKLANPIIQRLVKSLAPLCTVDFMLAWVRETQTTEAQQNAGSFDVMKIMKGTVSIVTNPRSFFSSKHTNVDLNVVRQLKTAVESRLLDMKTLDGLESALKYFVKDENFHALCKVKVGELLDNCRSMAPNLMHLSFRGN